MKPVHCRVGGEASDCVRACIASLLELEPEEVPNWAEDPENMLTDMQIWLLKRGKALVMLHLHGSATFEQIGKSVSQLIPDRYYMLWANVANGGDHAFLCYNAERVFDPAWIKSEIVGPHSSGFWFVFIVVDI